MKTCMGSCHFPQSSATSAEGKHFLSICYRTHIYIRFCTLIHVPVDIIAIDPKNVELPYQFPGCGRVVIQDKASVLCRSYIPSIFQSKVHESLVKKGILVLLRAVNRVILRRNGVMTSWICGFFLPPTSSTSLLTVAVLRLRNLRALKLLILGEEPCLLERLAESTLTAPGL